MDAEKENSATILGWAPSLENAGVVLGISNLQLYQSRCSATLDPSFSKSFSTAIVGSMG